MLGNKANKTNIHSIGLKKNGQSFGLGHKIFQMTPQKSNPMSFISPITQGNKKSYLEK
jgi:hypothetical protein